MAKVTDRTEGINNMENDVISRHEAIDRFNLIRPVDPRRSEYTHGIDVGIAMCIVAVRDQSSEPYEIIRCKDCRWHIDQSDSTSWLPCKEVITPNNYYCADAERRTDE